MFRHIVGGQGLEQFLAIAPCALRRISMKQPRSISREPGMQGVCGLLAPDELAGRNAEGVVLVLGEIVQHFRIEWELTPYQGSDSAGRPEAGFVLELNGTHEPAEPHSGRSCLHCANLMLGLRIVGDWLFPPKGKCSFCEVLARSNFVRGDQHGQQAGYTTRTLRLAGPRSPSCQLGACHIWCTAKTEERLRTIGAVERKRKPASTGRAEP